MTRFVRRKSTVDVVIPCYNYGRFLPACAASVLGQQDVDVRALIIDDASSDETPDVARELGRRNTRILYRRHESNHGHIATYNEGLDWAEAEFVMILSADDGLAPGALSRAALVMNSHPEVGFTYGRQLVFQSAWPDVAALPDVSWRIVPGTTLIESACESAQNPVPTPTAVVRTSVHRIVGGYRKELPHTADLELWLRLAAHGSIGILDAVQAVKRSHERNMQLRYVETALPDLVQRHEAFESFFQTYDATANLDRLAAAARGQLAREAFWNASRAFDRGDLAMCERLLVFAVRLDPHLLDRREWSRLKWKRRCGPVVWTVLRPVIESVRRSGQAAAASSTPSARL